MQLIGVLVLTSALIFQHKCSLDPSLPPLTHALALKNHYLNDYSPLSFFFVEKNEIPLMLLYF